MSKVFLKFAPTSCIAIAVIATLVLLPGCKKEKTSNCLQADLRILQAYHSPVWQPGGTLIGFNHTPLTGIALYNEPPCSFFNYKGNYDSAGFYLMNRDKTGFRRVTRVALRSPAWSPDGKWIAFSSGAHIYKMPFTGGTFDTTQMVRLTATGENDHPSWTANSDTIHYDAIVDASVIPIRYSIWKMAGDGSGKTRVSEPTATDDPREPFIGSDNRVYHTRRLSGIPQVCSMNKDGSDLRQLTNTGNHFKTIPKYWQGKIYYETLDGLYVFTEANSLPTKLTDEGVHTYNISTNGEVVYSSFKPDASAKDKQVGTLWTMNPDGTNKQQLTFNKL